MLHETIFQKHYNTVKILSFVRKHPYFLQTLVEPLIRAMSRVLYLLRHAKSSWSDSRLSDFDRPLNGRGRKAAPQMATYMKQHGLAPTFVLCSSARRAVETWDLMSPAFNADITVKLQRSLYLASPSRLLAALSYVPSTVDRVLVIAHNPGLAHLALNLAGPDSTPRALEELRQKYPTAALAEFQLVADTWSKIADGTTRLNRFVRPRDL